MNLVKILKQLAEAEPKQVKFLAYNLRDGWELNAVLILFLR